MTPLRFFMVGGVILVLTGLLQLLVRPRRSGEHRLLNRGIVWPAFCILFGIAAIAVGSGRLPVALPGASGSVESTQ